MRTGATSLAIHLLGAAGGTNRRQLWRDPVDGSPPQRLVTPAALETSSATNISISPDGRRLGYTDAVLVWDLCILENFLPPR